MLQWSALLSSVKQQKLVVGLMRDVVGESMGFTSLLYDCKHAASLFLCYFLASTLHWCISLLFVQNCNRLLMLMLFCPHTRVGACCRLELPVRLNLSLLLLRSLREFSLTDLLTRNELFVYANTKCSCLCECCFSSHMTLTMESGP